MRSILGGAPIQSFVYLKGRFENEQSSHWILLSEYDGKSTRIVKRLAGCVTLEAAMAAGRLLNGTR